jgi:hypothetical protein
MKVGNMVRTRYAVRTSPLQYANVAIVGAGQVGVVVAIRQTGYNTSYGKDGKDAIYVDVHLSVDGEIVRCGNHLASSFEVIA